MIEDKELRELFRVESDDYLQKLENLFLRLETGPEDIAALDEALRTLHALKGSAKMLGLREIDIIANGMEEVMVAWKKGVFPPDVIDRLYNAHDAIRKIAQEAVTGEESGVEVSSILRQLSKKAEEAPGPEAPKKREKRIEERPPGPEYRLDTIRVETRKIDELMKLAGELTVMKTKMAQLVLKSGEAAELWEEVLRNLSPYIQGAPQHYKRPFTSVRPESAQASVSRLGAIINDLKDSIYSDASRLEFIAAGIGDGVREARLLPFSTLFNLFPRMLRDMAKERSKGVALKIEGAETEADKLVIEKMKDPLIHMVRNAIDHGIEAPEVRESAGKPRTGNIRMSAYRTDTNVVIEVADDGKGLDIEEIKRIAVKRNMYSKEDISKLTAAETYLMIFRPGFSTAEFATDISGRGIGLNIVSTNVEFLKGTVQVESVPGAGAAFRIKLPVTVAMMRVILATVDGRKYAIPIDYVVSNIQIASEDIFFMNGRETIIVEGKPVSIGRLSEILELKEWFRKKTHAAKGVQKNACVVISIEGEIFGVIVDELLDEQEIVIKPHDSLLKRVPNISGSTVLGSGEICHILNPGDILRTLKKEGYAPAEKPAGVTEMKNAILLVEDSITTRTQLKRILEGAGYDVTTAVDGVDAMNKLPTRKFDAVVSDILMPNMDGLTLTAKLREDSRYKETPIILVTTLASEEDRKRGLEAGANAYISKPVFEQDVFLDILRMLV